MIIAFDPGETTGIAIAYHEDEDWPKLTFHTHVVRGMGELLEFWAARFGQPGQVVDGEGVTVIIERWKLFAGKASQKVGSEFPEIQVLGQIKLLCVMAGLNWKIQEPYDQAKSHWPESVLNKHGFSSKGKMTHERSAVCHILYYLKRKHSPSLLGPTK